MHVRHGVAVPLSGKTTFIVDDVWPEYQSYLASVRQAGDQVIAPGFFCKARLPRYGWGRSVSHRATVQTLLRHVAMRRVAKKSGAERQRAYLRHDLLIAEALAKVIDYRARHLVIAQAWLTWLAGAGVLGGRSYDVLMSRYPLAEVHRRLDAVAAASGPSKTISDFRADADLVRVESLALTNARKIITPHHGIAHLFPQKSLRLAWHRPPARSARKGHRTAFLGPTIARQRADVVREFAKSLPNPLIVMGADLEGENFWTGIDIERRFLDANWLNDVGSIIHPAAMTNQPRALLQALANGVTVFAGEGSGLARADYMPIENCTDVAV